MLLVAIDLDGFPFTWSASPPRAPQISDACAAANSA
jgi:hypothetical protein